MSKGEREAGEKIAFGARDDWDLISIIAHALSSKDPRNSIKELTENALDVFSGVRARHLPLEGRSVDVVIRKKDRKAPHIKVVDNGPGWEPHKDPNDSKYGKPDFEYTIKNIGNSIKKKYAEFNKAREEGTAVGQFAIGLFSFWALGGRLTVYSRSVLDDGTVGPCSLMVWHKEVRDAVIKHDIDPPPELASEPGTVVMIDQLEKAQMNLVTGNILGKYLGRACRTLLMRSGVSLVIDDHGSKLSVRPMKYEGTRFPVTEINTAEGFGQIKLEIYVFPPVESPDEFRVPIFCKGAKAYDDITELPELNQYPWNSGKVYGEINYPFGTISPSRSGLVNDSFLDAFIRTMQNITIELRGFVDDIEKKKKAKQREKFYSVFREKWQEIFKALPQEWHKPPVGPPPPPPPQTGWSITITSLPSTAAGATNPSGTVNITSGQSLIVTASANTGYSFLEWLFDGITYGSSNPVTIPAQTECSSHTLVARFVSSSPPQPLILGPMSRVEISPKETKVAYRSVQAFTARPYDINGNIIRDPSLIYYWKIIGKPLGILKNDMKRTCQLQVDSQDGVTTLAITVLQYGGKTDEEAPIKKTAATNVWVVEELPPPRPIPPPKEDQPPLPEEGNLGEDGPRSKFNTDLNYITINDHHKDFIEAKKKDEETYNRYFNYCYAKEIAVDRWKTLDAYELSERIIEVVALSERMMPWKELARKRRGRRPREAEAAWESRAFG
jgi:hypothetical protein